MSEALDKAKAIFDKELDDATAEVVRRWKVQYEKGKRAARLKSLARILKGGAGSGNWAHTGRPGKRGGSAPGGGSSLGTFATTPTLKALLSGRMEYSIHSTQKAIPAKVFKELGYDAKPEAVNSLDDAISQGDTELWRGVSGDNPEEAQVHANQFK